MNIAVIGNGLLGSTLKDVDPSVTVLSHADIDLMDPVSMRRTLDALRPDVVINTAALHDLAACEADPERAFALNGRAAERLARMVPTVYISTDFVFNDGGPHTESLPGKQPRSVYGRSKLAGELATLEHGGAVVRVASLYGHHASHKGPSFPQKLLSSHDPVRLPTDQVMSPTYAPDAAERILGVARRLQHARFAGANGIYHAANRGSCSWAHFAEHILATTGHERHVLPYAAKDRIRPKDSSLRNTKLPQALHWMRGLSQWAQVEGLQQIVSPRRDA